MAHVPSFVPSKLPPLCGNESELRAAYAATSGKRLYPARDSEAFRQLQSAAACALHMHQPNIPAGKDGAIISNLRFMLEDGPDGDRYNATVFRECYQRLGTIIPALVAEGYEPRIMVDYSGCLFFGLEEMEATDVIETLRTLAVDPRYQRCVEWLGTAWGHAVAPSTPIHDFRLHVRAWQHHFAALFGTEAVARVRGFSPPEMALPNHPDVAYGFVKTLVDAGYQWVLVQEHTVEEPESGHSPRSPHLPHRLVCRNSEGEEASIICLIKTQGSDTKLVAQMQPWYEAASLSHATLAGQFVPPIVSQIADGENGGVMMHEFPPKFIEVSKLSTGTRTPLMTGTEYLEHLFALGITQKDLPVLQPTKQKQLWSRFSPGTDSPEKLSATIGELTASDHTFHMEGGSWTNNISWVRDYDRLLKPMDRVSALFYEKVLQKGISESDPRFNEALFLLLNAETSCFRYWGEGVWVDYGIEFCHRLEKLLGS